MEQKLEKKCSPRELKEGYRYSITYIANMHSIFTVLRRSDDYFELQFLDGVKAGVFTTTPLHFYEFPFTPLEQELL